MLNPFFEYPDCTDTFGNYVAGGNDTVPLTGLCGALVALADSTLNIQS
jgi:hypothetical protein